MTYQVQINAGQHNVSLPGQDRLFNEGDVVDLTDDEYAATTVSARTSMFTVVTYTPESGGGITTETDPVAGPEIAAETARAEAAESAEQTRAEAAEQAEGDALTAHKTSGDHDARYAPAPAPGVVSQKWSDAPIDQSAAVQALIDQAVTTGKAWGCKVSLPPGVIYGTFKMRGNVILEGAGWSTTLKAMPGQTAPVIDYETYQAYHTTLQDLRADGNYIPGRLDGYADATCRVIHMDDINAGDETVIQQFIFNSLGANGPGAGNVLEDGNLPSGGVQYWTQNWNDPSNRIGNVFVTNSGGDWAVYIGINQRGTWINDLFINKSKLGTIKNIATDTQFTNIQAGTSSYGFYVGGTNQQWTQCKSWYVGKNAGYNTANGGGADQKNNGWTINIPSTTVSQTRLINCEGQDNAGHDLALTQSVGSIVKSFLSGGSGDGLYLGGTSQYNDIEIDFGGADLTGDTTLITLDGTNLKGNKVVWTANEAVLASSTAVSTLNGASTVYNNIKTYDAQGNDIQANVSSGTVTPKALNLATTITADTTVQAPDLMGVESYSYGDRLTIAVYAMGADRRVSWSASYNNVESTLVTMGTYRVFVFVWLGSGWWLERQQNPSQLAAGYGFGAVTEGKAYSSSVALTDTAIYTAPADVSFTNFPLIYFYNPTGAAITVTVKVTGVTVYTGSVGAAGTGSKANIPPLRPGDAVSISASAAGLTAWMPYQECRDPAWKLTRVAPASGALTTMYTVPAGKKARGVYAANNINTIWLAGPNAGNAVISYTPSGGGAVGITNNSPAANASLVATPILAELDAGDALSVTPNVAGMIALVLVQEY